MEGCSRYFEENAHQHERECRQYEGMILSGGREVCDLVYLSGSSSTEDQRDAVEQESGCEGAKKEVLDGRFWPAPCLLAITGKNVG